MRVHIKLDEEQKNGGIEHGIEEPSPNTVAAAFEKLQQENPNVASQVASEQNRLTVDHEGETGAGQPDSDPEPVGVNHGVEQSGGEYGQDLEGLGEFEPQEGHEDEDGLVEEVEEGQPPAAENCEECP